MLQITRQHEFFIGIDSDGCVFDTMELKHKECFIPEWIRHYRLQAVSRYAREAWEYVNLYSNSRGVNRFPALIESLRWLARRPETAARGVRIEVPESLVMWISEETKLGNPALEARLARAPDAELQQALDWSRDVNRSIERMVHGVPPFARVRECLARLADHADMVVCSGTPTAALRAEWSEHALDRYVRAIGGQEAGSKSQMLAAAADYAPHRALMIGDAPGDQRAAEASGCLFYPIVPGDEQASWEQFHDEGLARLLDGTFAGAYQKQLNDRFRRALASSPPWETPRPATRVS